MFDEYRSRGIPFCVSKYAANAAVHIKSPLLCLYSRFIYILSCLHRDDDDERGSSFFKAAAIVILRIEGSCVLLS